MVRCKDYDSIPAEDVCSIASKPWLKRTAKYDDSENVFNKFSTYVWDGRFNGLLRLRPSLHACFDTLYACITYYCSDRTTEARRSRHVVEVAKEILFLPCGSLV